MKKAPYISPKENTRAFQPKILIKHLPFSIYTPSYRIYDKNFNSLNNTTGRTQLTY